MDLINLNIDKINKLCDSNRVRTLFVFGSVLTDKFSNKSDVDFIVDINDENPISYADNYFNLKFHLEEILKRQVDLFELKAIKNKYFLEEIEKSKVLVYGNADKNMA